MRILVACEESQAVTKELRQLGHEAYSCDVVECSGEGTQWHIMQDVLPLLNGRCSFYTCDGVSHCITDRWDMIIAFPPCTHLAVSGAKHFEKKRADGRQREAIEFFCKILTADCDRIAVENPIGIIGGNYIPEHFPDLAEKYGLPIKPTQIIQPWQFALSEEEYVEKTTCLWLKGLPPLEPWILQKPEMTYIEFVSDNKIRRQTLWYYNTRCLPHSERGRAASKTFPGIAKAMAGWADSLCATQQEVRDEDRCVN